MNSLPPLKHLVLAFLLALVLYAAAFWYIENRRTRNGSWQVTFTSENGTPELVINEPKLNLANVKILFPGEKFSGTNTITVFAKPQQVPFDVPFGKCVFEDITFQPGTIVFTNFNHEVQLMPRVLTIDRQEHAWRSGGTIAVNKADTSRGAP